jgi:hypothetical protein
MFHVRYGNTLVNCKNVLKLYPCLCFATYGGGGWSGRSSMAVGMAAAGGGIWRGGGREGSVVGLVAEAAAVVVAVVADT